MAIIKGKADGGSGGKRGHSNMDHWMHTDEIKAAARKTRRLDAKVAIRSGLVDVAPTSRVRKPQAPSPEPEAQLASFLDKFEPATASLIRACRSRLRRLFPTANEIVYDNYNFFVIGYSPSLRPSETIVSLAAAAHGVGLSFYRGASLPDPTGVLLGGGKQNRFIRLPSASVLDDPAVRDLINAAVAHSDVPLSKVGRGATVIQSVSTKQRPRRQEGLPRASASASRRRGRR